MGVAVGLPRPASGTFPALPGRGTVTGPLGKVPAATAGDRAVRPGLPIRPAAVNCGKSIWDQSSEVDVSRLKFVLSL